MAAYAIVDFEVTCETAMGESVVIVGDHEALGEWDEAKAMKLETSEKAYPVWTCTGRPLLIEVPAGLKDTEVQFKIAKVQKDKEASYEEIEANRKVVVTSQGAGVHATVQASFGKAEKEALRIPKFSPPARGAAADRRPSVPTPTSTKDGDAGKTPSCDSLTKGDGAQMSRRWSTSSMGVKKVSTGEGLDFQMQATKECGKPISFWHDVPLFPVDDDGKVIPDQVNFVCEIPKTTRKKFEVNTKGEGNPIKQDTKNGKLREYSKGDIWFNYGCLPRTWEDTEFVHPDVGFPGDGDPLDACEIGMRMFETGEVRQTKVLGVICMIDEDETDWKLICIDVEDRWADELNNVDDVDRLLPGALDQIREWWRTYKVTDGKPLNKFGLDEKFMPREYAMDVIVECHDAWKKACAKVSEKPAKGMDKKVLSFSKLEDLDIATDMQAVERLTGA